MIERYTNTPRAQIHILKLCVERNESGGVKKHYVNVSV